MKFKTLALLLILAALHFNIYAQVEWGIKAGGNGSAMLLKDETGYTRVKLRPGFHFGGTADVSLSDRFFLQPALLFTTKGFKVDQQGFAEYLYGVDNIKFTSYYLELPVNFIFRPKLGSGKLLLGAGPYIAYGLGGQWKAVSDGISVKGKLKFLNDYSNLDSTMGGNSRTIPYMKPFDFGANILIGYEFRKDLYFHINGQLGLTDLDPAYNGASDERSSVKTVMGGLSVGYRF